MGHIGCCGVGKNIQDSNPQGQSVLKFESKRSSSTYSHKLCRMCRCMVSCHGMLHVLHMFCVRLFLNWTEKKLDLSTGLREPWSSRHSPEPQWMLAASVTSTSHADDSLAPRHRTQHLLLHAILPKTWARTTVFWRWFFTGCNHSGLSNMFFFVLTTHCRHTDYIDASSYNRHYSWEVKYASAQVFWRTVPEKLRQKLRTRTRKKGRRQLL